MHSAVAWKQFQINFGTAIAKCFEVEHGESCLMPSVDKMELCSLEGSWINLRSVLVPEANVVRRKTATAQQQQKAMGCPHKEANKRKIKKCKPKLRCFFICTHLLTEHIPI